MSAVNLLISAGRRFSDWRHRQQAYAELMALDDHSLADIGLHRSQIARRSMSPANTRRCSSFVAAIERIPVPVPISSGL